VLLLLFTLVTGTLGYMMLEDWRFLDAFWMVVITLTTIGYGEIHPLSDPGRWFTLALIIGGLSAASYTLTQLTQFVIEGDFGRLIHQRRRERLMKAMTDHFIVAGYGRLGMEVAAELRHSGYDVVVIESDPARLARADEDGHVALLGDASEDDVLRLAGVDRAIGLAVATSSNAVNVFVTLSAHQLSPALRIITRVESDEAANKARRAGASLVISPHGIGGAHMAHGLLRPESRMFLDLATTRMHRELEIEDVPVGAGGVTGTLLELRLRDRYQIMLIAVRRADGTMVSMPGSDTHLGPGDVAIVIGRPEHVAAFASAANPSRKRR
jgi:voltage-gated potassium channel